MSKFKESALCFFVIISSLVGYQVGLHDLFNLAHDELTVLRKHTNKDCTYQVHEDLLITICKRGE